MTPVPCRLALGQHERNFCNELLSCVMTDGNLHSFCFGRADTLENHSGGTLFAPCIPHAFAPKRHPRTPYAKPFSKRTARIPLRFLQRPFLLSPHWLESIRRTRPGLRSFLLGFKGHEQSTPCQHGAIMPLGKTHD